MSILSNCAKTMELKNQNKSIWPRVIILAFIMLALFDAYIIKQAISTRVATTTDSPYIDALSYEKIISAKQAAFTDGISINIDYKDHILSVEFDGLNSSSKNLLSMELLRPNDSGLDQKHSLESDNNLFSFRIDKLTPGLWIIRASLTTLSGNQKHYYFEKNKLIN